MAYTYNTHNGKLSEIWYGNGTWVTYTYDALDRISEIRYNISGNYSYKYEYDGDGNVSSVRDAINGTETVYQYDASGNNTLTIHYEPDEYGWMTAVMSRRAELDGQGRTSKLTYSFEDQTVTYEPTYLGSSTIILGWRITGVNLESTLDAFGRLSKAELRNGADTLLVDYTYTYEDKDTDRLYEGVEVIKETSTRVKTFSAVQYAGSTTKIITEYIYTYDERGNIKSIVKSKGSATQTDGVWSEYSWSALYTTSYYYDDVGQLYRENNQEAGKTFVYIHDDAGNLLRKQTYAYTTGALGTAEITNNLSYGNAEWGDQVTEVGAASMEVTHDEVGNIVGIGLTAVGQGYSFEWTQGRLLSEYKRFYADETDFRLEFSYNDEGIRVEKVYRYGEDFVNGLKHEYVVDGSTILREKIYYYDSTDATWSLTETLYYLYDEKGAPIGMCYETVRGYEYYYYYRKNLQGDIVAVLTEDGHEVVSYLYDAWGRILKETYAYSSDYVTTNDISIVKLNPFRYRGYYYDTDSSLYYLQSRYYNPAWCRFLSADSYINANGDLLGYNMYAYCSNNPVMYSDPTGESVTAAIIIGAIVGASIGFGATAYVDYTDDGEIFNGSVQPIDYVANTLLGGIAGAAVGYAAPTIGAFLSSSFTIATPLLVGGEAVAVTVSGAQIVGAGVLTATGVIAYSRIGKSGGYRIYHYYPNDHAPTHVHISGDDGTTRVDINGNPIQGDRPMTIGERKAFWKLIDKITEALQPWL